jgi:4-carboxymuconolactone decarboxylase
VTDPTTDRFTLGIHTAMELFADSPSPPAFSVPAEFAEEWNRFSMSTVMADVWNRPGLARPQRVLATIAILAALNRTEQLRAYIGVGLNQGLSRTEVCEVILHTAVYAGFPCAVEAFRIATEVFAEYDAAAAATVCADP